MTTRIHVAENLPVRTQFIIFTLFGDYVLANGGEIWTSSILYLMGLLGISERAVRSTLSRMVRKGWINPSKHGRRSQYVLTANGESLLVAGQARIFEPILSSWNGEWRLVVYSLPEKRRRLRHTLRKQLSWLGFGKLAPGTWISPHHRDRELENLMVDLGVVRYVEMFSGHLLGPSSAGELIHGCWDLGELAAQYQNFIDRYQEKYDRDLSHLNARKVIPPEECFITRFWMTHEFQSMPLKDPNLPSELLPDDWAGYQARKLFDDYRDLLGVDAEGFVRDVMRAGECPDGKSS